MRKRWGTIVVAVMLLVSSVAAPAHAVTKRDIQQKKEEIKNVQQKQSTIENKIEQSQQEIERLKAEQEQLDAEIKKLDLAVEETSANIRTKQQNIEETKQQIVALRKEIEEVTARIEQRNELLKERARSLQESGGVVSYLDVLLGAKSFSDFIDRMSAVATIFEADRQMIREQEADKALKEAKEEELNDNLVRLQEQLNELQKLKQTLSEQIAAKEKLMAQLKEEQKHEEEKQLALEEEKELLEKQEAAMKNQLQEMIRRQKEQEEARKRALSSRGSSSESGGSLPPVSDGAFMRPANGPITSTFGPRWGEFHYGVDIGKRGASVPVVAAADGYVYRSYYSPSYGNVIFIMHYIDGQVYTTVYAHLESRLVGEGQNVSKGQMIGYMGNTGRSFGAHLHFELHRGPWNASKSNAVNPMQYVPF
ncbi:PcsB-like coiled-coil domain-containing protein [Anoxybacillus flavithermus]|uniref:PcsB-like coiled-coil domain-containing protein n=1 Tax=Anoxybacillus flavithermus TaxID=33934 RepID=UPI0018660937|nr:peptidoglycan DD-metalloendopeptidase family protein [Anoxybacillus flavithermus]MBE2940394.1 peptidoglycan DD-metalloendopeptidase family protein [Anoxybacillus flavithermus]MBE2943097.1 peptidoglycan DD-metalloendopeptidase family protein [Anoxybacillus flavithermus]MBE2951492.1 peptidoglycan DD-metalloendopeptidase family protein [Anoxybacillus flavithermus]MBE2954060.1 peptidoglycan DD-metalloendopeptidase family protein [Anoxybacillus flavithermus]